MPASTRSLLRSSLVRPWDLLTIQVYGTVLLATTLAWWGIVSIFAATAAFTGYPEVIVGLGHASKVSLALVVLVSGAVVPTIVLNRPKSGEPAPSLLLPPPALAFGVVVGVRHLIGTSSGLNLIVATLFRRRLLILLSCRCRVEEDKDTASAVSDTDDSARCVWVGIGRSGPAPTGSLA